MIRSVLAVTLLLVATVSALNAFNDARNDFDRQRMTKRETLPCVNDGDQCVRGQSDCCGDFSICQKAAGDTVYKCSPNTKALSNCGVQPLLAKCDFSGYDKTLPPAMALTGGSTNVKVNVYLRSIVKYQDTGLYNLELYLGAIWNDPRLAHLENRVLVYNSKEQLDGIWQPDLYFSGVVQTYRPDIPTPNLSLRIYQSGLVRLNQDIHVITACSATACNLRLESYASVKSAMNAVWDSDSPISIDSSIGSQVTGSISTCSQDAADSQGREFTCLVATFNLNPSCIR